MEKWLKKTVTKVKSEFNRRRCMIRCGTHLRLLVKTNDLSPTSDYVTSQALRKNIEWPRNMTLHFPDRVLRLD